VSKELKGVSRHHNKGMVIGNHSRELGTGRDANGGACVTGRCTRCETNASSVFLRRLGDCHEISIWKDTLQENVSPLCKSSVPGACKPLIDRESERGRSSAFVPQAYDSKGTGLSTTEPLVMFAGAHPNFDGCKLMILNKIGRP
jgi:hypothetical protein